MSCDGFWLQNKSLPSRENSTTRKKDYRSDGKFGNPNSNFLRKFFFYMEIISIELLIHPLLHSLIVDAM